MNELKTLKDLEFRFSNIQIGLLKAEAMKYVKELRKEWKDNSGKTDFIKHFFNLTETDLEDKE